MVISPLKIFHTGRFFLKWRVGEKEQNDENTGKCPTSGKLR